jgi:hypothetical protein
MELYLIGLLAWLLFMALGLAALRRLEKAGKARGRTMPQDAATDAQQPVVTILESAPVDYIEGTCRHA